VTILLVIHFMEEAERLCDQAAVNDRRQLVAIDTSRHLGSVDRPRPPLVARGLVNIDANALIIWWLQAGSSDQRPGSAPGFLHRTPDA
jgi:ABC-type multidrug transport system ATPase subunit